MEILFDSNVIIDALSHSEGANLDSQSLWLLAAEGEIDGYICSKQITDIHYVLRRYIPKEEDRMKAIDIILNSFSVLPLDKGDLSKASVLKWNDFEDAVISVIAKKYKIDYITTSDIKHFASSSVPVLSPSECMKKYKRGNH